MRSNGSSLSDFTHLKHRRHAMPLHPQRPALKPRLHAQGKSDRPGDRKPVISYPLPVTYRFPMFPDASRSIVAHATSRARHAMSCLHHVDVTSAP
ncbi:hypothetical protein C7S13_7027 [Burkholderia cepacia]|nr:hypothetical protein [Burkholderia cepacia]